MLPAKCYKKENGNGLPSASLQVNVPADKMDNQQTRNPPPREIPDSQEDPDDAALSDNDQAADLGGYDTEEDETPAVAKKATYVSIVLHCFYSM